MKTETCLAAALLVVAAFAHAETPEPTIAFAGNLKSRLPNISTAVPIALDFRIYDSAREDTGPLWGRRVSVKMNGAGDFYVDLNDSAGNASVLDPSYTLVQALSHVAGQAQIGIKPIGGEEFSPRITLTRYSRAAHAAVASSTERARIGGTLVLDDIAADRLSTTGGATVSNVVSAALTGSLDGSDSWVGSDEWTRVRLEGGVKGIGETDWTLSSVEEESGTRCDQMIYYHTADGMVFALPLPAGSVIAAPADGDSVSRISRRTFGNP
jgi:hypothetical protein